MSIDEICDPVLTSDLVGILVKEDEKLHWVFFRGGGVRRGLKRGEGGGVVVEGVGKTDREREEEGEEWNGGGISSRS
jgi:hypothetical protein